MQNQRNALEGQVEVARRELAALEAARLAKVAQFRAAALSASDFQKLKDDPLSRMTAYQELKNDPKDGATITLFSWMTKFLVIFLEIVPVVAKMFFSPPSVYAARIQATVNRGREEAFRLPPPVTSPPALEPELAVPRFAPAQLARKLDEWPRPEPRRAGRSGAEELRSVTERKVSEEERSDATPTLLRPKPEVRSPARPSVGAGAGAGDVTRVAEVRQPEPERSDPL